MPASLAFRTRVLALTLPLALLASSCGASDARPVHVVTATSVPPAVVALQGQVETLRTALLSSNADQQDLRRQLEELRASRSATKPRIAPSVPVSRPAVVSRPVGACGGWQSLMAQFFPPEQVGNACRVMMCESGGSPTSVNRSSGAAGLFQGLRSTWGGYAGYPTADAAPPAVQVEWASRLWRMKGWRPWVCRP